MLLSMAEMKVCRKYMIGTGITYDVTVNGRDERVVDRKAMVVTGTSRDNWNVTTSCGPGMHCLACRAGQP